MVFSALQGLSAGARFVNGDKSVETLTSTQEGLSGEQICLRLPLVDENIEAPSPSNSPSMAPSVTSSQAPTQSVNCGNHAASSCSACPNGNGAAWCNGDCYWSNNQCLLATGPVVRCGGTTAATCGECPGACGGDCQECNGACQPVNDHCASDSPSAAPSLTASAQPSDAVVKSTKAQRRTGRRPYRSESGPITR